MHIVLRTNIKCMREKNCERENKGLREKKAQRAEEESKRLRGQINDADSVEGENKMHEGGKNMSRDFTFLFLLHVCHFSPWHHLHLLFLP